MVIIIDDFNIRDSDWDSYVYHYFIYIDDLITIIDSLGLEFSSPSNPSPTGFMNNPQDSNSGIDLVFRPPNNSGFVSQLCYGPVVIYYMVYHYTKRATLARLLANEGPAIYVVHLNRYFVIPL